MSSFSVDALDARDQLPPLLSACERAREGGENAVGEDLARRALTLATSTGDGCGAARASVLLALHMFRQGRSCEVVQHGRSWLQQVDSSGLPAWSIELRNTLTMACSEVGLPNEALSYAVDALHRSHLLESAPLLAWSLNRLGTTLERLGNFEHALEYLRQSTEIAERCGDREARFAAHVNTAVTLMQRVRTNMPDADPQSQVRDARDALQAIELATALCGTHPHQRMYCCGIECSALLAAGDLISMREAVQRYQALAIRHGVACFIQLGLLYEADWLIEAGRAVEACALLNERVDETEIEVNLEWMRWLLGMRHRANKAAGQDSVALVAVEALLDLERRDARTRLDAQMRLSLRDMEVQNARYEAQRLRRRAGELERTAEAAASAALQDPLTCLANRRALDARLAERLPRHGGQRSALHAAMIDIDHFKAVNDGHGHAVGDDVLRELARLLRDSTRADDLVARCGGEEFVLVMSGSGSEAFDICERVRRQVEHHHWEAITPGLYVTLSAGLATAGREDDPASLLARADAALYEAKRSGRNRVIVADAG